MKKLLLLIVTFLLPLYLLCLSGLGLVSESWLLYEYSRPGFPADSFGLEEKERTRFAILGLRYVSGEIPRTDLEQLRISQQPAFSDREMDHLEDVRAIVAIVKVFVLLFSLATLTIFGIAFLSGTYKDQYVSIFRAGSLATILSIGVVCLAIFFSWETSFEMFHAVLFEEGTWSFYESDLLIRLYPERFWIDSAVALSLASLSNAGLIYLYCQKLSTKTS